jgi:hypothetical protein
MVPDPADDRVGFRVAEIAESLPRQEVNPGPLGTGIATADNDKRGFAKSQALPRLRVDVMRRLSRLQIITLGWARLICR